MCLIFVIFLACTSSSSEQNCCSATSRESGRTSGRHTTIVPALMPLRGCLTRHGDDTRKARYLRAKILGRGGLPKGEKSTAALHL
jgi:hypothetical protein